MGINQEKGRSEKGGEIIAVRQGRQSMMARLRKRREPGKTKKKKRDWARLGKEGELHG